MLTLITLSYITIACAQQIGTLTAENHPSLTWQKCTKEGGCVSQNGFVTLDSNWRWTHEVEGSTNCYTGNKWDATICTDDVTCAAKCALDGANYSGTYGVSANGNALTLKFVTQAAQKNIGSRLYLMSSDTEYQLFKLLDKEFTFDVDVSQLPCGLNGALYFSEMPADGGISSTNKAGAKYGTGYCDAQCPRDLKFIGGKANVEGWVPDTNNPNTGKGNRGACCNEMDIWEANSISTAFTAHPCSGNGLQTCTGTACGGSNDRYGSICDPDGCDFNSYRLGKPNFYGPGKTVNTKEKFTVVTQFLAGTYGSLREIRRFYVQNGKVIPNSFTSIPGIKATNSITPAFCDAQKSVFGDTKSFQSKGGFPTMSGALSRGMVLVLSLWDDYEANMLWLNSNYPTNKAASTRGVGRGTCSTSSGVPATVEAQNPNAEVTYSNIKFGDIGSTFSARGRS